MTGVLVALDFPSLSQAGEMADRLKDTVTGFKVGLELLFSDGPEAVEAIAARGKPVFADAKLHDIPNTVRRSAERLRSAGARWVTVHAGGGQAMIEGAVEALGVGAGVLAVTVLTSIDETDASAVGIADGVDAQVERLAVLALNAGAEGVICSANEIGTIRRVSPHLTIVVPGIRLEGDSANDQARVATPTAAASAGADYLVIGRSITTSNDPEITANEIMKTLDGRG